MTWGRRTTGALAAAAVGVALTGCGGEVVSSGPTEVVIPGSTTTIGTEVGTGAAEPVETTSDEPTDEPTDEPEAAASVGDLLQRVGPAMNEYRSVHVDVGNGTTTIVASDHQYLDSDDFVAEVLTDPAVPVEVRRVGGVLYVAEGPDAAFEEVIDPASAEPGSVEAAYPSWSVLTDLAAILDDAAVSSFAPGGPDDVDGTAVTRYELTLDAGVVAGAAQVPDDVTGAVEVTFSVDGAGLPVRVDQSFADGSLVRYDYSAWGEPVEVEVP